VRKRDHKHSAGAIDLTTSTRMVLAFSIAMPNLYGINYTDIFNKLKI
jgi:hypothetical protein